MFKAFKGISLQIVKEVFQFRDAVSYQLRKRTDFQIPQCFQWHKKYKIYWTKNLENFAS